MSDVIHLVSVAGGQSTDRDGGQLRGLADTPTRRSVARAPRASSVLGPKLERVMNFRHHWRNRRTLSVACRRAVAVPGRAQGRNRGAMPGSPPREHAFTARFLHACVGRATFGAVFIRKVHNTL